MTSEIENLLFDLHSDVEDTRVSACRILAKVGDESAIEALKEATKDEAPAVRYFASKALEAVKKRVQAITPPIEKTKTDSITYKIEHSQLSESDFRNLLYDPDEKTRIEVIDNASRISLLFDKRIVLSSLIALLGKEKSTFVLPSLIKNVGLLGDASVAFILVPYLKNEDSRVRANTVEALEYLNCEDVFPNILPLLKDLDHRVRANAAMALQAYGETNALKVIKGMLDSEEVWMRDAATFALGEIRNKDSAILLVDILKEESKYSICVKAVKGLEQIGGRIVLPLVLKLRSSVTDERKQQMIDYLVRRFNGEQVSLVDFVDDETALMDVSLSGRKVPTKKVTERDKQIREFYDDGLKALDSGNYHEALDLFQTISKEYPDSSYAPITRYMVETIREEKGFTPVPPESPVADEPEKTEGATILEEPATVVELKEGELPEEREPEPAPAETIPEKAEPVVPEEPDDVVEQVERLIKDLANPDEDVREQAVFKLMAIEDPRAIKPLTKATMDQDNVVRYFAKKALKKFQEAEEKKSFLESEKAQAVKRSLVEVVGKRNLIIAIGLCVVLALASGTKLIYTQIKTRRAFSQAEDLFIRARYQDAIPLFKTVLDAKPDTIEAYARLADIFYLTNRHAKAITQIKKIGKIDKSVVTYQRFSAKRFLLSQQYNKAIELYGNLLGKAPNDLQMNYELGICYLEKGLLDEAMEKMKALLTLKPEFTGARFVRGNLLGKKGRLDDEIKAYLEIIAENERFPQIFQYLGVAHYKKGDFGKAVEAFKKALSVNPGNTNVRFNLALSYEDQEKYDEAIAEYSRVIEKEPDNLSARLNLGVLYGKLGDTDKEIEEYKAINKIDPKYPDIYFNAGIIQYNKDNIKQAMRMFKRTLSCDPNYTKAYYNLGVLYQQQGNDHLARNYLRKVLQLDPGHDKAQAALKALEQG